MSITESQRRALDVTAEAIGWNWADVEILSELLFSECVAGLTAGKADDLLWELTAEGADAVIIGVEVNDAGA